MAEFAVVAALLQAPRVRQSRCVQLHQLLSLSCMSLLGPQSCQPQRWGVVERRLPAKTQGRTVDSFQ